MIFKRSFFSELINTTGGAFTVLFTIVIAVGMVRILGLAAGGRVDSATIVELILYNALVNLPPLLTVALFIATLMTLMRWWQDNEMVVWFSSGARSLFSFVSPVLRFTIPMVILIALLSLVIAPWAQTKNEEAKAQFRQRDDVSLITPGRFIETNHGKRVFFIESVTKDRNVEGVFVAERHGDKSSVVTAQSGQIEVNQEGDRYIVLHDGRRYETSPQTAQTRVVQFEDYGVRLDLRLDSPFFTTKLAAQPTSVLVASMTPENQGQLFWRISWPLAALNLALLAIPLSFSNPRSGRSMSIIMAALIFILYLNAVSIMVTWIEHGKFTLWSGLFTLNGFVLGVVVINFIRWVYFMRWLPPQCSIWYWRHRYSRSEGAQS